jgi:putative MFS transporter
MTPFESAPFSSFHRRVAISGAGGQFSDGYSLGIIGVALNLAKEPLGLTTWWIGAVGAASLIGLFVGCLVAGAVADRFGRRPVYFWGMLIFTILAGLQYHSTSIYELFIWRLLLGIALGGDYVSSDAIVSEYSPTEKRGYLLSFLSIAWTAGYLLSFVVGYLSRNSGPEAWRIVLVTCAAPSLITFLLRFNIPESPVWLTRQGQFDKARDIVSKHIGSEIALPVVLELNKSEPGALTNLFKQPLLRNLVVGCVFFTAQVIPGFALGTFLPIVLTELNVGDSYTGALIYNVFLMLGVLIGMLIIDRIPRRTFVIQGFVWMAILLSILILWRTAPTIITVSLFSVYAFVIASTGILQMVYPPELFPTEVRARGIGIVIACSRIGAASSTFFLPAVVNEYGVYCALGFCVLICIVAGLVCWMWAPETLHKRLV